MGRRGNFKGRSNFRGRGNYRGKHPNSRPGKDFQYRYQPSQRPPNEPQNRQKIFSSLREDQVGITEHLREGAGFVGTIKSRFSDFHVNEIDVDGNEVKLTDQSLPIAEEECIEDLELETNKKELESIITEEIWQNIRELLVNTETGRNASIDIDVTSLEKDKRTLMHKTLKGEFGSALVSNTETVGEKKIIKCFKAKVHQEVKRRVWPWSGEYVYFVVHKENIDTVRAAADLAHHIGCRASSITYAGTKDKRAKTSQRMCMKMREPKHIMRAANKLPYMQIGNFSFHTKTVKLGDLKGNRFRIAIRQISGEEEDIRNALKSIQEKGFINYYGLQRFGNCSGVPTYKVGIALLKREYKQACELIMKPRTGEPPFMTEAREHWWKNRNSAAAAAMIPNKFMEKKLLIGLAEFGENDYVNALRKIPRNMLLLYTHSYQSLIWNRIASRRVKEFGLKLIPGDLVYKEKTHADTSEGGAIIYEGEANFSDEEEEEDNGSKTESHYKSMVKPITENDILESQYTIYDVVLPLPGHYITYPDNEVSKWYAEMLSEEGLSSEKLKHNQKTFSLAGAYRKLLVRPENLTFDFKRYATPTSTLIASDWDELQGVKADEDDSDGQFKALIVNFSLPSSTYATMALRELLQYDTSVSSQQKLEEQLNAQESENKGNGNSPEDVETAKEAIDEDNSIASRRVDNTDGGGLSQKRKICETEIELKKKKVE